jgi:homoserine/homoserine lactone efflux protein
MDLSVWLPFFVASWAISLSPGAGAIAAMSAGLNHGFRRGYWMTLGLILGILTQLLVVAVGLGTLIAASTLAFSIVKWAGVGYLLTLGIKQWRAPATLVPEPVAGSTEAGGIRQLILRGWIINALNPKGTVFLLAVVPQFLNLTQPLALQYIAIGATLAFTDLVVMAGYTLLAAKMLRMLRSPQQVRWINRIFGGLFVAAAALLAGFKRAT